MKSFLTTAFLAAATVPASAHPGAHEQITTLPSALGHLLGSPFHAALLLAGVALALATGLVLRRRVLARVARKRN